MRDAHWDESTVKRARGATCPHCGSVGIELDQDAYLEQRSSGIPDTRAGAPVNTHEIGWCPSCTLEAAIYEFLYHDMFLGV